MTAAFDLVVACNDHMHGNTAPLLALGHQPKNLGDVCRLMWAAMDQCTPAERARIAQHDKMVAGYAAAQGRSMTSCMYPPRYIPACLTRIA